jgi:hypothetical protein
MAFKALNEVFDGRLALPGKDGKIYHVPEPDAELGAWCTAMFAAGVAINLGEDPPAGGLPPLQLDDSAEDAMYLRVLGEALLEQLRADGYGATTVRLFGQTAFIWIAASAEAAEGFWNSGGDPKASAPGRAQRRAAKPPASVSTPSTAGASTTPGAASTSGMPPRKAPSKAPAARRSPGK